VHDLRGIEASHRHDLLRFGRFRGRKHRLAAQLFGQLGESLEVASSCAGNGPNRSHPLLEHRIMLDRESRHDSGGKSDPLDG
jgi:hypothetical protein